MQRKRKKFQCSMISIVMKFLQETVSLHG
uniref:Uncharacterized protein n=1 Tax=Arundo donax TaxID=35708 RepID=A0A0A9FW38_ARUDO